MTVNNIGPKIKKIRQERGWTQKQLAELLSFSESLLSYIENGARSFDVKDLHKLAEIFKVPYTYFLDDYNFANFRAEVESGSPQQNYDKVMDDFIKFAKNKLGKK